MIRVEDLYRSFGGQRVLRGLTLQVAQGEIMVVIGRSGGGKSVLLKHLLGLLRPDSGRVVVNGTDITHLRGPALDRIRERYGVVFQGGALFDSMSVFDNVAFPLREKTRKRDDHLPPICEHGERKFGGAESDRKTAKWLCPVGACKPIRRKASRLHPLIPYGSTRWKKRFASRSAVERAFSRLQNFHSLDELRVRGLDRVALHGDLCLLAMLAQALARARAVPLAA